MGRKRKRRRARGKREKTSGRVQREDPLQEIEVDADRATRKRPVRPLQSARFDPNVKWFFERGPLQEAPIPEGIK